ncbi:PAS domain S-box protein [Geomonas sp. Red32]|uniref:PAS domain S-box protein n=1 Tax=Geomonas sp. Red32 TaxID=2912856 RepID=UPI00202CF6D6|nr:PAS domain S-box protein [Geomonas sp. Red32]MCM0082959.1 PAS domain S-box protein [Geomonas sp. Red32]
MDPKVQQELRQLLDDYLRMYATRDDRLTASFSEDFSGFTGGGDFLVKERAAWVEITRQDFAQVKDPLRLELKDVALQSLSDTIAVATSFFVIHLPLEDQVLSRTVARLVLIFRRESEGWKIAHSSISLPDGMVRESEVFPLQELALRNRFLEKLVEERTCQLSAAMANLKLTNEKLAQEIAMHERAEAALSQSESHYRLLTENASDVVWRADRDYCITYISPADERLRGYAAHEVVGLHVFDLLAEEGIAKVRDAVVLRQEAERQGVRTGTHTFEALHRCKDGRSLWGEVSSTPERDPHGAIIGYHGISRDITQRKEYERERLKMEKLESLGALAGGIAHDFNNILTAIMGNITFARMFLPAEHDALKPLDQAEKASLRAAELARQLLTFARGGKPVKKAISLQQLVHETASLVLGGSNVKGHLDIPDSVHAVEADEGQMIQVLHNVILNATQAMPGGGDLLIGAQNVNLERENALELPAGGYVRLDFTDRGCGISCADLTRIFDPYFTTKASGNGLGLTSAHSIITRHGGHIGVRSTQGIGSTFTIHLPSLGRTLEKEPADAAAPVPGRLPGDRILVMDDEQMIRDMTVEMLGGLGYQVETCESGEEATARYEEARLSGAPFSAVILDLTIPGGMGGKEAAERILAVDPQACLIVSSGYFHDPIMADYSRYGFRGAIEKPYTLDRFLRLLGSVLASKAVAPPPKG